MIYRLDDELNIFPPPEDAEEDGLLAVGGDLSPARLVNAYLHGIFPWYNEPPVLWWCPKERFVIFPREIHISASMKKFMRKTDWEVRFDTAFPEVMHACRQLREQEGTWINDDMEEAYGRLFQLGYASSAEVWDGGRLIGGLYGVRIGRCFFGESMFSKAPNASKLALIRLAQVLAEAEFAFIDCQFHTDHLESMGGRYISLKEYTELVRKYGIPG